MPDGSRQSTSDRSDSAIRSVGRSRIDGASWGTFSSERRSPNWTLPSMSTVFCPAWPIATARLNAMVVLPTPPFGAKIEKTRVASLDELAFELLADPGDPVHQVEPRERHREHAVDAVGRIDLDRVLGHGQHDDRDVELGRVDLFDELGALDPALEQGVDEHDIGAQLADLGERLAAVGQDVEDLDRLLGVEQAADVLRDLWHVLDDEQARLVVAVRHANRRYHAGGPVRGAGRPRRGGGRHPGPTPALSLGTTPRSSRS